jgi:hypothetical protein
MGKDFWPEAETSKPSWLPVLAGGLLVGGAIVTSISEGIDAVDFCRVGFTSPVSTCQPAILPSADLPHRDHVPAATRNIAVVATSTSSTTATPSITVAPTAR